MIKEDQILLMDFDSTFVTIETLEYLSELALKDNPRRKEIVYEISEITKQGMEGKISFAESLDRRLRLFKAHRNHVDQLSNDLHDKVTPSIKKHKQFFKDNSHRIYIISGGFKDYMLPVLSQYGIKSNHIFGNEFIYKEDGYIEGYNKDNPLSKERGKVRQLQNARIKGNIHVVGDGYTDWEIRQAGLADKFIVFTENVSRLAVVKNADLIANDFDKVINL